MRVPAGVEDQELEAPPADEAAADADYCREMAGTILERARAGGEAQRSAVAYIRRCAFTNKATSRAAQLALEEAQGCCAAALASSLHGHVRAAMRSMYANYVLQKIVEVMPSSCTSFIPQELLGAGKEVSRHRFGCRILCRLLEHGSLHDRYTAALLEEVLGDAKPLVRHEFGNYVVRHGLEFGLPEHRRMIAHAVCADVLGNARHEYGSRVVEAALQFCQAEDQQAIVTELLWDPGELLLLATALSGRHVVKALLRLPGEHKQQAAACLRPFSAQLRASKFGAPVLKAIEAIAA